MSGEDNRAMLNRVCIMVMLGTCILLQIVYLPGEYEDAFWEIYFVAVQATR